MRSYNTAPRGARRLMLGGPEAERPAASPPCAVRAPGFNPARPAGLATPAYREMIHCHARDRMLAHERPRRFDPEASIAAPGEANSRAASSADTRLETTLGDFSPLACAYGEQSAKRAVRADGSNGQGGIGEGSRRCDRAGVLEPQAGSPVRVQARVRVTWLVTWQGAWVTWRRARATWPHASAYCSRRRQVRRAQLQWVWALQRPASTY